MARARPRRAPVPFHAAPPPAAAEAHFPAAVAGEQYERYAKSVWAQAHRWLSAIGRALRSARPRRSTSDKRLRAVAAIDINRHLHPQEEQLLSEIVHASWAARVEARARVDDVCRRCDEDSEPR